MINKKGIAVILLALTSNLFAGGGKYRENRYGEDNHPGFFDLLFDTTYMPRLERIARKFGKFSIQNYGLPALNFGVLVNNQYHQIYRSKALGEEGAEQLFTHLVVNNLPLPTRVIFINKDGYKKKSWAKIPFVTYFVRGTDNFAYQEHRIFNPRGRFPEIEFLHPFNQEVYLHGHNPMFDETEYDAAKYTDAESTRVFGLTQGRRIVARKSNFFRILELILSNQGPVLFHCTGGIHRTGMVAMAIRYLQGGIWVRSFADPIRVVSYNAVTTGEEVFLRNYAEVEYVMHNHNNVRLENLEAVRQLVAEPEFQELYEQYHGSLNQ